MTSLPINGMKGIGGRDAQPVLPRESTPAQRSVGLRPCSLMHGSHGSGRVVQGTARGPDDIIVTFDSARMFRTEEWATLPAR